VIFSPGFPLSLDITEQLLMLAAAWLWDRFGEPPAAIHPVVWMGRLIGFLAGRRRHLPHLELIRGFAIALVVPGVFWAGSTAVLLGLTDNPVLRFIVGVWLLKSSFALATLAKAALAVRRALDEGDLTAARVGLGSLCSRDASELTEAQLAAGAIESVAENASDSVVAPLLFFVCFGIPGALAYRAVNTADAMIGYRGRYEYLGKAVARLDDALNYLPARLTALLLLVVGKLQGLPVRSGLFILLRDGAKTESPNAGRPMAAMAGLLGVELEKPGAYRLGDPLQPLDGAMIRRAVRLLRWMGWLVLILVAQSLVWIAG
jgi:adenosylcobinamide-phosphate synthase